MLTDAEMEQLRNPEGAKFDRLFLRAMIRHHEGAIEIAEHQLDTGMHPDAKAMAQSIITSQQAEIEHMRQLFDTQ